GEEKVNARSWDLQLKVRTAEGEVLYICFAEERFYYTEGERTVFFEAKDNADYHALYQKLQALINEK
ncbi:MAG: hypothetical protein IJY22_01105, partial [Clostridia bacterium]|nr:hypothetical protein [Clostridia bacterium]